MRQELAETATGGGTPPPTDNTNEALYGADASAGPGAVRDGAATPRVATTAVFDRHFDYSDHAACMHRLKVW